MTEAIETLRKSGVEVYVTPQNFVEAWNAMARPRERNGFGMSPAEASGEVDRIRGFFRLAEDTPAIFEEWLRLVREVGVSGVKVHDARLVAVMNAHRLTHLLTLNPQDFTRFTGITVVEPQALAGGAA